jgi:hypothetical protein
MTLYNHILTVYNIIVLCQANNIVTQDQLISKICVTIEHSLANRLL